LEDEIMMDFNAGDLIKEIKAEVADEVKKIVKDTVRDIIDASPTPLNSAGYSRGSYVKSHRVALDHADESVSMVPEGEVDEGAVDTAREQIDKVDELIKDDPIVTVVISNNVEHAIDVETGDSWQKTPGYHPYEKAAQKLQD